MTVLPFDIGSGTDDMAEVVRRYWGFDSLRPLQQDAIRAELDRREPHSPLASSVQPARASF